MNESMIQGQIIRPFSPAIGKYKLSDDTVTTPVSYTHLTLPTTPYV